MCIQFNIKSQLGSLNYCTIVGDLVWKALFHRKWIKLFYIWGAIIILLLLWNSAASFTRHASRWLTEIIINTCLPNSTTESIDRWNELPRNNIPFIPFLLLFSAQSGCCVATTTTSTPNRSFSAWQWWIFGCKSTFRFISRNSLSLHTIHIFWLPVLPNNGSTFSLQYWREYWHCAIRFLLQSPIASQ